MVQNIVLERAPKIRLFVVKQKLLINEYLRKCFAKNFSTKLFQYFCQSREE